MESKSNVNTAADSGAAQKPSLDEPSVTMMDVLELEKEMEDEYAAVLGGSDEKSCTYSQGPIKRQALYSCLTCCPEARNNLENCAGVCLACSYRCHEHHELVELYTKRNFRCDCPTERMGGKPCVLNGAVATKLPKNVGNKYNHNFQALYCRCKRPYPDPESDTEEVMWQCIVCEDWYHLQHMDVPAGASKLVDACAEIICGDCMQKHKVLQDYAGLAMRVVDNNETEANISIVNEDDVSKTVTESAKANEVVDEVKQMTGEEQPSKRQKLEEEDAEPNETANSSTPKCLRPAVNSAYEKGATFWNSDWRKALCQCAKCLELYKAENLEFLLDGEDTVKCYEERGIRRAATESSIYEQGMEALGSMGRVQQIDAIIAYNRMKERLMEYLQEFAANNKIVTEADIKLFFEGMRQERNTDIGAQNFCR